MHYNVLNDSSWRVSKLANQRLYIIGGESPNKIDAF